ncbi:MAG: TonB-dependent receptor, partial [Muribaculaceae bacterium]|nr:TonB-dependent receptor [Muribaculaceae bacterium]
MGHSFALNEVEITTSFNRALIVSDVEKGILKIDGAKMDDEIGFLSSPDVIQLLKTLPYSATTNEMQANISIRGGGSDDTRFTADGAPILNPMHLLGFFSSFNPDFYRNYTLQPGRISAVTPAASGGFFQALSAAIPDTSVNMSISLGLIESHGAVNIPLSKGKASLSLGGRITYIDKIYPHLLTDGSSTLLYSFGDLNGTLISRFTDNDVVRISLFASKDRLGVDNIKNGTKDGKFGWSNLAVSSEWRHDHLTAILSYSSFDNDFLLEEGGYRIDLPSSFKIMKGQTEIALPFGLTAETDVSFCISSPQSNRSFSRNAHTRQWSFTWNLGANYVNTFGPLMVEGGIRNMVYHCGDYDVFFPQPRLNLAWKIDERFNIFGAYGMAIGAERLVPESRGGLPIDFWVCADDRVKPLVSHNFELGLAGMLWESGINFNIEAYYRILRNRLEYTGSLLHWVVPGYDPISDVHAGKGYAAGVSVMLSRQFGKFRGRVGGNIGKSRTFIPAISDGYFPSSSDRPLDVSALITWQPCFPFSMSAQFTHASGLPYTRAKFGYILGDNLICEYFPH